MRSIGRNTAEEIRDWPRVLMQNLHEVMAAVRRSGTFKEVAIDYGSTRMSWAGQRGLKIASGSYAFYWPYFDVLHAELATRFHKLLLLHRILTKDWKVAGSAPKVRYAFSASYCFHSSMNG